MRRSKTIRFFDATGGLNTRSPITSLALNEAVDLQNVNLLPNGGFEKRRGNSVFNSSAMASGAAVHGLGYYRQGDGDEWLVAICGTVLAKADSLDGTMDTITGSLTITAGQDHIWTHSVMNDLSIFVGGNRATDVPIKWNGSGNGAVLGGTPPVGAFGILANNRFFIGNTVANPSRIQWSVLGNPESWTASGSGSQDVSTNDGDTLVGAALLGIDNLLLFKQNSIHSLVVRTSPFPLFPLFRNVGAVSKRGIVQVGDMVYFITPEPRMKATDGTRIYDSRNPGPTGISDKIDNVWDGLNKSRLQYTHGIYYPKYQQIMWFCSNGSASTHNYCIIWDLVRKCWLRHTTGYSMNVSTMAQDYLLYTGAYDGKIYKQDVGSDFSDASETSGAINAYWKTGFYDLQSMINAKNVPYVDVNFTTQTSGTFDFGYAYDFSTTTKNSSLSMVAPGDKWGSMLWGVGLWGGQTDRTKIVFTKGKGKFVQFFVRNQNDGEALSFNGFEFPVKDGAPFALR